MISTYGILRTSTRLIYCGLTEMKVATAEACQRIRLRRTMAYRLFTLIQVSFVLLVITLSRPLSAAPAVDQALVAKLKDVVSRADSFDDRFEAEVWLMQKSEVLKRYIKDPDQRLELLREVHKAASMVDLPPELVLSVIHVESLFDPYAVSVVGAQGIMQVMPFWKKEIGRETDNLTDLKTNLRYGCTILKHYLDRERGYWPRALARYNGSYGKYWYPTKVMKRWRKYWR